MKKTLSLFALIVTVVVFTACHKSGTNETKVVYLQDTTGMYASNYLTDKNGEPTGYKIGAAMDRAGVERRRLSAGSTASSRKISGSNTSENAAMTTAYATAKKKGWSHKAKAAAVGAGTGAITGAIINKNNRGLGAVVGAGVGAASGYIIGNEVDKKKERQKQ